MKLDIIVIDDSPLQLSVTSKLIAKNDHLNLIGIYSNPFLGLSAVNDQKADLVLLDIEMPEIDGLSLLKLFNDSVEVILNSANFFYENQAHDSRAVDFLRKPLTRSKLNTSVSRVLALNEIKNSPTQIVM